MKVIYVVLVCLLAFTSCAETEYAENGVDKKNITGYTEVGFYSLDGICTFTEQEQLQAAINPKRLTYRLQNSDQSGSSSNLVVISFLFRWFSSSSFLIL